MKWRSTIFRGLVGLAALGVAFGPGAALAATTEELLRASAGQPGVCVHLGRSDSPLVLRLAAGGRLLVQCLEADDSKVAAVRKALTEQGLYGPVTVVPWAEAWLPYEDNLVNVLVAEDAAGVPESEFMRVLVPNGVLWRRQGEDWTMRRKPWPAEYDEWTHWRHGADGNMVSHDRAVTAPTGLRWAAGPAQDEGGKKWYYDHTMMSANGRNFYIYEDGITARDAFNGTRLWTRALKVYNFKETGTAVPDFLKPKIKVGTRTSKVKPVASANHLYVAAEGQLMALDAASGQTAQVYGEVSGPREVLVEGQVLVVCDSNAVRAYHLGTTKAMWETKLAAERVVAGDGGVYCLANSVIACLDLATGKERWRSVNTNAIPATTCTYHDGILVLEKSSWRNDEGGCGILVYCGKDGALLWRCSGRRITSRP